MKEILHSKTELDSEQWLDTEIAESNKTVQTAVHSEFFSGPSLLTLCGSRVKATWGSGQRVHI